MKKAITIMSAVLVFVVTYFVGKQIDLSDQALAIYNSFSNEESIQKASLYKAQ